jgi:cytochrome c2
MIEMGTWLDDPQRDGSFEPDTCVVSTGPAADRQAKCLMVSGCLLPRPLCRLWCRVALWSVVAAMAVASAAPVAAQFGGKPTRPQVEPPKGPVRQVIFKNCTACHGIDDYAYNALDRAGWNALIDSKHKDLNVRIQVKDRDLLLDWAVAKFGPDSRPFPRAYIPPEITTFFSDPEAQTLLDRACTTCHGLDRVNETRYSPDKWRVTALDMRQRGAKLTDEELERLVEWLGRVKGTNPNQ